MFRTFCSLLILSASVASAKDEALRKDLESTYKTWRHSIQTENDLLWRKVTATHRQIAVKNRILSEKRRYPASIFDLPAIPPSLDGLKHLACHRVGPTAKSYYFGKIDFGIGGNPAENLLVLSFVGATNAWKYDQAEVVNLAVLPEIKKQLAAGDISYINATPELLPTGTVPPNPVEVKEAPYIAKVYVYCPGREVRVQVNQISMHDFSNAKDAELIIGGAKDGQNQIQYSVRKLVEEEIAEPMTIRVYLMSTVIGVKPIKIFEYLVPEDGKPVDFGKGTFVVDAKVRNQLLGRQP